MNDLPDEADIDPWGMPPTPSPRPSPGPPPLPVAVDSKPFGPEAPPQFEESAFLPSPVKPPPRKRRMLVGALLTAVILALLLGLGWSLTSGLRDSEPLAASTAEPTPEPASEPTIQVQGANLYDGVAEIAELVGPAVVQLDTNLGLGSGVLYDSNGYILTAAHVIEGALTVDVRLADGRLFEGVVVGTHPQTDIAVVKIEGSGFPTAELALGIDTRVGALAVALGSPFGLSQSVTAGIVSAVDRDIQNVPMVQTDAAINPGNSGGPLVDGAGRVIGINDQIFTNSGGNEGIGFAVSIELAKLVADQLVAGQDVQLAFLGVSTETSNAIRTGALVQDVQAGSAAEDAGLQVGDLIIAIDGDPVASASDLKVNIINTPPESEILIDILRNGEPLTLTATLGRL